MLFALSTKLRRSPSTSTLGWMAVRALSGAGGSQCASATTNAAAAAGRPIRWGILSAGKIASDYAKAVRVTPGAEVVAVAARDGHRAAAFAEKHGIPASHGSYAALLQNPDVDVVYVGSVADQHADQAKACILAGKPVVVEKPLTLQYAQAKELVDLAADRQCFLMEGMWTRCFPAMRRVSTLIHEEGAIGRPVAVQGDFGWSTAGCGEQDRIWFPDSGGMILDIGMYLAQLGQVAFGKDCQVENIQAVGSMKHGVDHTAAANCLYRFQHPAAGTSSDNGNNHNKEDAVGVLQFYVTGEANTEERVCIQGTEGRIIVEGPAHVPQRIRVDADRGRGRDAVEAFDYPLPDDSYTTWNYPGSIGFTHQIEAVGDALRRGLTECPHFTWNDSLQVAAMLDVIRAQVKRGAKNKKGDPAAPAADEDERLSVAQ